MQQKTLFKASLIFSLVGIFILLFLANSIEPKQTNIKEINNKMLNQKVKVSGTILNIQDKESFKILSISDSTGKIDVLCECKDNLKENQKITVIGTIGEYGSYLQISADKILCLFT